MNSEPLEEVLQIKTIDAEIIKDGTSYLVSDNDITGTSLEVLSFVSSGIKQTQHFNDTIDGRSRLYEGVEDKYRTISMTVRMDAEYAQRVAHLRDSINELFDGVYYIREMRVKSHDVQFELPGQSTGKMQQSEPEYVNGKQIQVTKVNSIEIDDSELATTFNVELETVYLPYFESIYTTKELNDTGFEATAEKYGLVDGINAEYTQYVFTDNNFAVYNAGNVAIVPEQMMLDITIRGMTTSDVFKLENLTTGEVFEFRKAVTDRNIYLEGMNVHEGSYNALRDTNRKFVSLVPGVNEFQVSGGTFSEITFTTRFIYK